MNDNDDFFPFLIIFLLVAGLSFMFGFNTGETSTKRETISYCVEKPADCKIKYDFYKLENKK